VPAQENQGDNVNQQTCSSYFIKSGGAAIVSDALQHSVGKQLRT